MLGKRTKAIDTFTWAGREYTFDATACYRGSNLIRLPDGTLLAMRGWLESLPPIPTGLYEAGPHMLTAGEPVPATEPREDKL